MNVLPSNKPVAGVTKIARPNNRNNKALVTILVVAGLLMAVSAIIGIVIGTERKPESPRPRQRSRREPDDDDDEPEPKPKPKPPEPEPEPEPKPEPKPEVVDVNLPK